MWKVEADVMTYNLHPIVDVSKVAGLDMDGTLIVGDPFSKRWIARDKAKDVLHKLIDEGYHIAIFSNAGGVEAGKTTTDDIVNKMTDVFSYYEIENRCSALFALTKSHMRKPLTGMWKTFITNSQFQSPIETIKGSSFFVGDAGGRSGDFSCTDRDFAYNVGIRYFTPEQFFDGRKEPSIKCKHLDPEDYYPTTISEAKEICYIHSKDYETLDTEIVLMMGYQASGKSTFARRVFKSYTLVSRDIDGGTIAKSLKRTKELVLEGKSVVVDNTNVDLGTRKKYYNLGKELKVPVRLFYMNTPFELCMKFLRYMRMERNGSPYIPDVAMYMARKKLDEPKETEGCTELTIVPFLPPVTYKEFYMRYPYGNF